MIEHRGEVLFLPADPPRLGTFALWHPPPPGVGTATTVDVVQPDADGLRPRRMPARMLPVAAAVPWLTALREGAGVAAGLRLPQSHRLVVRDGGQPAAVRRESYVAHIAGVSFEGSGVAAAAS